MSNILVLNYDEALSFTKQFRDEGEDIVQLYSNTRQRMHLLRDEWSGEAAEAFYEDMELELLPALQRVSGALFLCSEVLTKVMKITHSADEETVGFFGKDLDSSFGLGAFQKPFVDAFLDKNQPAPIPPAPKAEEPQPDEKPLPGTDSGGASGGGGTESGDSRGIKGDLKGMGTGVSAPAPQADSTQGNRAGGSPQVMSSHGQGGSNGTVGGVSKQADVAGNSNGDNGQSTGNVGVGDGIAGAVGVTAIGGAAQKILKK